MFNNIEHPIILSAPAKINLFLHVTGKEKNGYHLLQSLIALADFGDEITITPSSHFTLKIKNQNNLLPVDPKKNLITKAAYTLAKELNKPMDFTIELTKNIPIGAGLGGGSSDAATTIAGLLRYWDINLEQGKLNHILFSLGADVPVCYHGKNCYVEGFGEKISKINNFPESYAVIAYPNKFCSTANIFKSYNTPYSEKITLPENFTSSQELLLFLMKTKNDLTPVAIENTPEIKDVIEKIEQQDGCQIARMSGSGSACFGIFKTKNLSIKAAENIKKEKPEWFTKAVKLK